MKRLLLLLLLFAFTKGYSQADCKKWVFEKYDIVTDVKMRQTKDIILATNNKKESLGISCVKNRYNTMIFVDAGNICIDDGDAVHFLFRDGTRASIYNDDSFNCNGSFLRRIKSFEREEEEFLFLSSKEINIMRLETKTKSIEVKLTEKQSLMFMNSVKCLFDDWKLE